VQLLTLTSDFIAPALTPAKSPDLNPEVAPDQEWEHFQTCSSMKWSSSGVHVFELAFEHMEDILNTDFKYV